ncbi:hypothetical protein AB0L99_10050 [Streptomyces sp. NPDC051954]|uniref:hypothetical protein n=1 Tax=Streptomyces sp. NPDC051954 TaxID=3155524 RepID=UPI00341674F9
MGTSSRRAVSQEAVGARLSLGLRGSCGRRGEKQEPRSERADLVSFQLDDRSQAGLTDIWVVWTIKNSSSERSDYSWDWEAVDAKRTRLTNGSELETAVQPGQTARGESPTTLRSATGIKLNITGFNRTASY